MNRPLITITLTKPEARLCRDAAKQFGPGPLIAAEVVECEQRLSRPEWFNLSRWLTWRATDLEVGLQLAERVASDNLAARIEAVLERWDLANPPVREAVPEPERELQGTLF